MRKKVRKLGSWSEQKKIREIEREGESDFV
jgi:hypothetical protein